MIKDEPKQCDPDKGRHYFPDNGWVCQCGKIDRRKKMMTVC